MDWTTIVWGIIAGALIGAFTALVGYLKGTELEKADPQKAFVTAFIGLIVGGVAAYKGIPFDEAYQFVLAAGFIVFLNQLALMIYRRSGLAAWVQKHWATPPAHPEPVPDVEAAIEDKV